MTEYIRRERLLSNYPELFSQTYWAGGNYYDSRLEEEISICMNRDVIAETYKLKKLLPKDKTNQKFAHYFKVLDTESVNEKDLRDHIEYYKTKDNNIVCIFSNYGYYEPHHIIFTAHGYNRIKPVYGSDCISYMKIIHPTRGPIDI